MITGTSNPQPAVGYALREQNQPFVDEPAWNGVELDFQRASDPLRLEPYLAGLRFDYVSLHTLQLSVAGPEPPHRRYLDELRDVATENGAKAISDHLGFTHATKAGPATGHVTAPPFTEAALDATCRNVELIQRHFEGFDFYLENLAHPFLLGGTMSEGEFMARMIERTGCGLLLDVTNAYANERNFATETREFMAEVIPAASRIQMHLAGGVFDPRLHRYVDTHSEPIPEAVWELYRLALDLGQRRVEAVFIERDMNFPAESGWRSEVQRARAVLGEREAAA